jgi:hypothetical protein
MESKLGRYLEPKEVVDHIDGNTLNNSPENLRLFQSNADHLKETLSGKIPEWSELGKKNLVGRQGVIETPVDTHDLKRNSGELRKQRILHARAQLDKDAPVPSDMQRLLERRKRA